MTEYTKEDYLKACEALFDGKPTEYIKNGDTFTRCEKSWQAPPDPFWAKFYKWRPVDPLREYKEAFKAGKRVERRNLKEGSAWWKMTTAYDWNDDGPNYEYRIVEEPKTVRLYQWAYKTSGEWYISSQFFADEKDFRKIYKADQVKKLGDTFIEVEV